MNEYDQLEEELRRLRPVRPPQALVDRLAEALGRDETAIGADVRRPASWVWGRAIAAAAAALLIAILGIRSVRSHREESAATRAALAATPVRVETPAAIPSPAPAETRVVIPSTRARSDYVRYAYGTALLGERNMGPVFVSEGLPIQAVRYTLVDQARYRDVGRGRVFTAMVPREEVRFVPVRCD